MSDLTARQAALEQHFGELASARTGARVFALEHGLDPPQRAEVRQLLHAELAVRPPSDEHWLVWSVYAAEIGYDYAGREYWQTFEKETPCWRRKGSRHWIRECFQQFATRFSGFKPTGPWAEHFSIICWPIAHAVLPKDLQARIARILYDVRHSFTPTTLGEPGALGALLCTRGWLGSARLEQLADDVDSIGSIALSLLLRDGQHMGMPLLTTTVDRIADDLSRQRHAREWLQDARTSARTITLKGLSRPKTSPPPASVNPTNGLEARRILDELGVQPTVSLIPSAEGRMVMLGLPNLSPLLRRFPELRDYLTSARPRVMGSSGQPLARQRVLQGDEHIRLHTWPQSTDVILRFENAPDLLRVVLGAECLLRPGPTWVFRLGSDNVAYELRGRVVRVGQEYLILRASNEGDCAWNELALVPEQIACEGVYGFRLRVPALASDSYIKALQALNLSIARAIRVRPAGLAAAGWDGSGYGEWLAGERPHLAVSADHEVETFCCRLQGSEELVVSGQTLLEAPVFIELPELPIGAHVAEFQFKASDGSVDIGQLELLIRDRRQWAPGMTHDGALAAIVDPPAPTLEDVWSDRATIDVHGPSTHNLECRVRFWNRPGRKDRYSQQLPPLKLPVTRGQWSAHFRTFCRLVADSQNAYDHADGITLDFVSPDVGRFELSAEREFTPLRWIARHKNQRYTLWLRDDRGVEEPPTITHYAFDAPAAAKGLASEPFGDGVQVEGGLYVAAAGSQSTAIIVAPRTFSLDGLKRDPSVAIVERKVGPIVQLLRTIELWSRARQVGSAFSLMFAVQSLRALVNALYGALVDPAWAELESGDLHDLRRAIGHVGLGRSLADDWAEYSRMTPQRRADRFEQTLAIELATPGARRAAQDPRERLAEVALRFASDPGGLRAWAETDKRLRGMINLLLHSQLATRAARYLVLGTARQIAPVHLGDQGLLYSGWEW